LIKLRSLAEIHLKRYDCLGAMRGPLVDNRSQNDPEAGNPAANIGNVSIYANGGNASRDIVYAVVLQAAGSFTASDRRISISSKSAGYDLRPQDAQLTVVQGYC
jgi:hypothetical protein